MPRSLLPHPRMGIRLTVPNSSRYRCDRSALAFPRSGVAVAAIVREVTLDRFVGLGLVAVVLALAPAAHASPPDQSWIPGLYDNADFDDVVLLITSNLGAIQPLLVWSSRSVAPAVGLVTPPNPGPRPQFPLSSVLGRAPPFA